MRDETSGSHEVPAAAPENVGSARGVRHTNAAEPPAPVEPVELDWQGTKMFGCPFCGRNNENRGWTEQHIAEQHPGGEAP